VVVAALLLYGIGTVAFALCGAAFFVWAILLALVGSPFLLVAMRRRKRQLAARRAARRRARVAGYADPWLEWEEAA
jgi:heme exporter protein D